MNEYASRIERLQQKMKALQLDAFILAQNVDLYYLTGSMQAGHLVVSAEGESKFFVRRSVVRAQGESAVPVEAIGPFRAFGEQIIQSFPQLAAASGKQVRIAAEFDVLPVQQLQRLQNVLPHVEWLDGSRLIRETRMIKSPSEIVTIREAAQIIDGAFEHALTLLKPGMTELELISILEQFMRIRGHFGMMRMRGFNHDAVIGMVVSGSAAAVPTYFDGPTGGQGLSPAFPQSASRKPIERNEPILIDFGCFVDGYTIDQTRTVVIGQLPDDLLQAYESSERIIRSVETMLQPGESCERLYLHSLQLASDFGLSEHYMGYGEDQVKFLGHGFGLEIDELPVLAKGFDIPLEPGMVLAIEPKFVFPQRGVVGIENDYLITENGYEKLTITREGLICL